MVLLEVFGMSCAETFGNFNLKRFAQSGNSAHHNLGLGILGYAGVLFFLIRAFALKNLLVVTVLWEGMITVIGAASAYFFLGERFKHPVQWLGLLLAILSVLIIHWGEHLHSR
jgi:multidrug transporter EmrE-like cation transporter